MYEDTEKFDLEMENLYKKMGKQAFRITKQNLKEKEYDQRKTTFNSFTKDREWEKFSEKCETTEIALDITEGGKGQDKLSARNTIKLFQIIPKDLELAKNTKSTHSAIIYAHPSNGLFFDAEMFIFECCKIAVTLNCMVFSVDYRKAPKYILDDMHSDFCRGISHVIDNAVKYQVN